MKRTLNLPEEAATADLYAPRSRNCPGIPKATELSDIALIDIAFKLLTTNDIKTKTMAQELAATTIKRGGTNDPESITQYISGSLVVPFDKSSHDKSSIWSKARRPSKSQGVLWDLQQENYSLVVNVNEIEEEGSQSSKN